MSKNLWTKYYQENKERTQNNIVNDIKILPNPSNNMVVKSTKISQEMKNKSLRGIEKILQNEKKCFIIIMRNYDFKR